MLNISTTWQIFANKGQILTFKMPVWYIYQMPNFVITVLAYVLAPDGAKPSAVTELAAKLYIFLSKVSLVINDFV